MFIQIDTEMIRYRKDNFMLMTDFQFEYNYKLKKSLSKVSSKYKQIMI